MSATAKNLWGKTKGLFNPPGVIWPTRNKALRQTGVVLGVALAVSLLMLNALVLMLKILTLLPNLLKSIKLILLLWLLMILWY